ncbi:hypothetical protein XSR1_10328 [Xenorhabdus szentirmaii DSM 16338]|uniref:Uncharacterized protein n=1 Tax=Xenorhabdus szentirmaii DSM 16338 TaxID=1427518 RepID=W1IQZ9_9GAMM|nr:hypothetical protein XSR1_10328 [Xenorhabdus szentirmaii DSM 16338]
MLVWSFLKQGLRFFSFLPLILSDASQVRTLLAEYRRLNTFFDIESPYNFKNHLNIKGLSICLLLKFVHFGPNYRLLWFCLWGYPANKLWLMPI